jgi:thiopeptide-type bacteriocin biosynthesis protein
LKIFKFIPRIEYSKTILSRKTWLLDKGDFEEILSININVDSYKIEQWQKKWQLPQYFVISEGDNELLIDLRNPTNILSLLNEVRKNGNVKLKEFLFLDESKSTSNIQFANECVAFLKRNQGRKKTKLRNNISSSEITRKFILGDDWVYYKVYCGVKYADDILVNLIYPFIARIEEKNLIHKWFFIRYYDQDSHLRLRFKTKDLTSLNKLILEVNRLFKPYIDNYLIDKLVTDTYDRELERYGTACIEEVESIFNIDSRTILKILVLIRNHTDPDIRWLCALHLINDTLDLFDFGLKQKKEFASSYATSFLHEHNGNSQLKMQVNKIVRDRKRKVLSFLSSENVTDPSASELLYVIRERKTLIRPYIQKIISTKNKENSVFDQLTFGLIHMTINRIFISKQRTYEMVLYHILVNFYKTQNALVELK